ncbi:PAQR family membrane homeostasis protein TrhA [Gephyromycinifex aptenodytis]|uniref:PAQR family membrane homeostasis protein TrhA n=1 Tax=Gephyromycinifex aptenodytis TaxID=2716227 RepID=UPI0014470A58|nr:hemolysin III family protein [Gephyromycinifex aptenodytis]
MAHRDSQFPPAAPAHTDRSHDEPGPVTETGASVAPAAAPPPKPRLRGWLHAAMVPVVLIGGVVLVLASPPGRIRWGMTVFVITATLLFATSAAYHRGRWNERTARVLKRLDHANIFLIIAGTYTAFATTLLTRQEAGPLLWVMWIGAAAGVVFSTVWMQAPRWLSTPLYVLLGWVAIFYIRAFYASGGALIVTLIAVGGVLYTVGALVYGLRRPNPAPRWFGFHEVFHTLTILGFGAHAVAASILIASAPA